MWPLLFGLASVAVIGLAFAGYRSYRADPLDVLSPEDRALIKPAVQRKRQRTGVFGWLGQRLGTSLTEMFGSSYRTYVERRLALADGKTFSDYGQFMAYKGSLLVIALLAGGLLGALTGSLILTLLIIAVAFAIPDLLLHLNGRKRQAMIEDELPDFLDVLAVTVSAGLSFRSALSKVIERSEGPLAAEMQHTLRQMDVGESVYDAFTKLRARTDSDSLESFITALLQSQELGSPLSDALDQIAVDMRQTTAQKARQKASKASPQIAGVVTLVMVPGTMALMLIVMYFVSGLDETTFLGG
ncbi:tight adherence protein C [Brevibacterium pityocampae]